MFLSTLSEPSPEPSAAPYTDSSTVFLTAEERRALLEDIGHVALTLGRSLYPVLFASSVTNTPENGLPASPARVRRPGALTSPQERLHLLVTLWADLEAPLRVLLRSPNSQPRTVTRSMSMARSQGTRESACHLARTPRAAAAWHRLMREQADNALLNAPNGNPTLSHNAANPDIVPYSESEPRPEDSSHASSRPDQTPVSARFTTLTHDTWPNRLVVTLLTHIAQEANALSRLAHFYECQSEAAQANTLEYAARRFRRHPVLRHCPLLSDAEQAYMAAGETILRSAPAYHVVYRVWRDLHHPLDFDWTYSPLLTLPALESWRLYEMWCYLQVSAALLRAGGKVSDGGSLLRCTPRGLQLTLSTGQMSRLQFTGREGRGAGKAKSETVSLYYQPLFVNANQRHSNKKYKNRKYESGESQSEKYESGKYESGKYESGKTETERAASRKQSAFAFCSRSHAMQPDIALQVRGRLILLDPKFKRFATPEEAQEDIDKMHTYCDAIVSEATAQGANRTPRAAAVASAWCLFAGWTGEGTAQVSTSVASQSTGDVSANVLASADRDAAASVCPATAIYAYPAATLTHPYGAANVGAFQLRPGQPDTAIRLSAFLAALRQDL